MSAIIDLINHHFENHAGSVLVALPDGSCALWFPDGSALHLAGREVSEQRCKHGDRIVEVNNPDFVRDIRNHYDRLERLKALRDGIPGEIARKYLRGVTLVAVNYGDKTVNYYLYDSADGTHRPVSCEDARTLAAIGFVK